MNSASSQSSCNIYLKTHNTVFILNMAMQYKISRTKHQKVSVIPNLLFQAENDLLEKSIDQYVGQLYH